MALYIGLMSGTSLDGVDGVLVDLGSTLGPPIILRAHQHQPFPAALRAELLALNAPGDNELQRAELAASAVARSYAAVVQVLLRDSASAARDVRGSAPTARPCATARANSTAPASRRNFSMARCWPS